LDIHIVDVAVEKWFVKGFGTVFKESNFCEAFAHQ